MSQAQKTDDVDLFGAPVTQVRERWGRASFKKTKENQQFVALMVANGETQEDIAEVLGCDPKTLRKHFSRELAEGARLIRIQMMQILYANARRGNNAAASKIIKMTDDARPRRMAKAQQLPSEPKAKRLGKKEALLEDVKNVPDEWSGLLPQSIN